VLMLPCLFAFAASGFVAPSLSSLHAASGMPLMGDGLRMMAGFEQKAPVSLDDRISLLLRGPDALLAAMPDCVRKNGGGLKGVVYDLGGERLEVIAEGSKEELNKLTGALEESVSAESEASCRTAWQEPVGGYDPQFPIIQLEPKMKARIAMKGSDGDLDYYSRHLQIEAVFNRGLKMNRNGFKRGDTEMNLDVAGDSGRIKSFLRWCQRGPPLARADEVKITWSK